MPLFDILPELLGQGLQLIQTTKNDIYSALPCPMLRLVLPIILSDVSGVLGELFQQYLQHDKKPSCLDGVFNPIVLTTSEKDI